jgi:hypothetical protein
LVGVLSTTQAVTLDSKNMVQTEARLASSEAAAATQPPCVYLDETMEELEYQIDMFSRTLDERHWTNVLNLQKAIEKKSGKPVKIETHVWDLMDKSFDFPRIRRYDFVEENMNMLEHFEDNFNTNITNSVNFANFLRVARTVKAQFLEKYHDGEYDDPALVDPKKEAAAAAEKAAKKVVY